MLQRYQISVFISSHALGFEKFVSGKFNFFCLQIIQQDVKQQEPVFERIIRNGQDRIDDSEPGTERDALEQKLDDAEKQWNDVKTRSEKKTKDIERLHPRSKKYKDDSVSFSVWLEKAEKKKDDIEKQPLLSDENGLKKQLKDTEVIYV